MFLLSNKGDIKILTKGGIALLIDEKYLVNESDFIRKCIQRNPKYRPDIDELIEIISNLSHQKFCKEVFFGFKKFIYSPKTTEKIKIAA